MSNPIPPPQLDEHIEKLQAWARVNLGMLPGEFLALTPCEFFPLIDAWTARDRRERILVAQVCLTIASASGAKTSSGEPLSLSYFLGEKPTAKVKGKRRSLKQQFIDSLPAHYRPNGHS